MKTFSDLPLSEPVSKAIAEMGYSTPTPIQAQALPILLQQDTDFLGLAATGTGKTGAFGIPLIEGIKTEERGVQALILCPTRELALQITGQINLLGKYRGIKALPIYGGTGYGDQIYGLKRGTQIVVGTPGRVIDHMEKGTLKLDQLKFVILDEADEMISMGFKEDLEIILSSAPVENRVTWLFSATMSPDVRKVADTYLHEPKQVQVNRNEMLPATVEQTYFLTQDAHKLEILCKIIDHADEFYGIVFCQTKALVTDINQQLLAKGYRSDCLHGDMDQNSRERTMRAFRDRKVSILVATDVACRGLDVKDITHVINYSIPRELDSYIHRIGRTGRSGKSGHAMSLITASQRGLVSRIERVTRSKMSEGKVPTRKEIGTKRVGKLLEKFASEQATKRASELLNNEWKTALSAMSPEEVAARFIAMTYPDLFIEKAKTTVKIVGEVITPRGAANASTGSASEHRRSHKPHYKERTHAEQPLPRGKVKQPFAKEWKHSPRSSTRDDRRPGKGKFKAPHQETRAPRTRHG